MSLKFRILTLVVLKINISRFFNLGDGRAQYDFVDFIDNEWSLKTRNIKKKRESIFVKFQLWSMIVLIWSGDSVFVFPSSYDPYLEERWRGQHLYSGWVFESRRLVGISVMFKIFRLVILLFLHNWEFFCVQSTSFRWFTSFWCWR